MDEMQILGYVIVALVTVGSFSTLIIKIMKPINDLRIVIQKLNDNIDVIKSDSECHETKIEEHEHRINTIDSRVGTLETKVEIYHNSEGR